MLDVGAYTGIFSIAASVRYPSLTVHAFEIVPAVVRLLGQNVERNDLQGRVHIHGFGIGKPDTAIRMPAGDQGSALPSFYSSKTRFARGIDVPFEPLDALVPWFDSSTRILMKVDVEGTENDVFRFGREFLRIFAPDVLCEVLYGVADAEALSSLLDPHGYLYYLIEQRSLLPMTALHPDRLYRDWLITRRDAASLRRSGIAVSDRSLA